MWRALEADLAQKSASGASPCRLRARWQAWCAALRPARPPGGIDEQALYRDNLSSGMLRAEP